MSELGPKRFRSEITYQPNYDRIDGTIKAAYIQRAQNAEPLAGREFAVDRYSLAELIRTLMAKYAEAELMLEPEQFDIVYQPKIQAIEESEIGNLQPLFKFLAKELEYGMNDVLNLVSHNRELAKTFSDNPELSEPLEKFNQDLRIYGVAYKAFLESLKQKSFDPRMLNLLVDAVKEIKLSSMVLEAGVTAAKNITFDFRADLINRLGLIHEIGGSLSFLQKLVYPKVNH
jgi:hypothetical protein